MYVDTCTNTRNGKKYTRHLLRRCYRENGKIKHDTITNLSRCSPNEIEAIRFALKHKDRLKELIAALESAPHIKPHALRQGASLGAVWLLFDIAEQLGIAKALGSSRQGKLVLWQVIARAIEHGSRLSAVRLAGSHAACDVLGLDSFCEDHLYANLDWLAKNQAKIEDRLFRKLREDAPPKLYLYDVTSSYLEGEQNAFAAFGYNRDGKKGKRQIVLGLLCNEDGIPLSIEVFRGNTNDPKTVASQVSKIAERFGGGAVTFVGDRGMIKSKQVEDLREHGLHYITAITKPQVEALLSRDVIQMGLFDNDLSEVTDENRVRYILRRNPVRAAEVQESREDRLKALREFAKKQTVYLTEHSRAKEGVALRKVVERCEQLRLHGFVGVAATGREIIIKVDESLLAEAAKLDGCSVLKTDLQPGEASKETVHARYKDLALVEWAFRTCKTVQLEMRPVHVRLAGRTRGHAFVVMLAYRLVQELAKRWSGLDTTVEEGLAELGALCATEVEIGDGGWVCVIPAPRPRAQALLEAAQVRLPEMLPKSNAVVATRKKLPVRRVTR